MIDDEHCSAEDIGGNLGGPCTCSGCAHERDVLKQAEQLGVRVVDKAPPLLETGRTSYAGVVSLPPRTDGIDRSRYVYEGPNGTARDPRDYSPHERLRVPLVFAAPPDSPALRDALSRAKAEPLRVVTVELKRRTCVCGVDLDEIAAEGKAGHVCAALRPEVTVETLTIPAIDARRAQLESAARTFAELDPGLYATVTRQLKLDHKAAEKGRRALRRAALAYAAEILKLDRAEAERDDWYDDAIAELDERARMEDPDEM